MTRRKTKEPAPAAERTAVWRYGAPVHVDIFARADMASAGRTAIVTLHVDDAALTEAVRTAVGEYLER